MSMRRARLFWGNLPGMHCPLPYCDEDHTAQRQGLEDKLFPTRTTRVTYYLIIYLRYYFSPEAAQSIVMSICVCLFVSFSLAYFENHANKLRQIFVLDACDRSSVLL